jgi:RNAse (barnase) inhibitor barstar
MNRKELADTLPQADRAGVFSLPAGDIPAIVDVATALDFAVFRVSLAGCTETSEVLARFQEKLAFPDWFGGNWDALTDCLTDFSWRKAVGYLLVIEEPGDFRAAGDDDFDTLISILSEASASWSGLGVPFWGFLVLDP